MRAAKRLTVRPTLSVMFRVGPRSADLSPNNMSNPTLKRFCVELDSARVDKVKAFLLKKHKTGRELVEHVIDNIERLRPALDATASNPRRRK